MVKGHFRVIDHSTRCIKAQKPGLGTGEDFTIPDATRAGKFPLWPHISVTDAVQQALLCGTCYTSFLIV